MARKNKLILLGIIAVLAILIGIYFQYSAVHTSPEKKTVAHVQPAKPQHGQQAHQAIVAGKPKPADTLTQQPSNTSEQYVHPTGMALEPKPADTFAEQSSKTLPQIIPPPIPAAPESTVAVVVPKEPVPAHKDTLPAVIPPIVVLDTIPPHVHAEPAGGLFDAGVNVKLRADKQCTIEWKTEQDTQWNTYTAQGIAVDSTTSITIRAHDTGNNTMSSYSEVYQIRKKASSQLCPNGMVLIDSDTGRFCIDMYEWPNKKGIVPTTYVSYYQAADSCTNAGKRLCTSDEWILACSGPNKTPYPYGSDYDLYACVTNDTVLRPAGSRSTCKGYFDVFDMSGNVAEWTSTRAQKYSQYYNVMGGFWDSGRQSSCYDVRFSYFPQNRHNPVGFRCCSGLVPQQGAR